MRRHHRKTIITLLAIVLALSTTAAVQAARSSSGQDYRRSPHVERYENQKKIRHLAVKLDRAAGLLHRSAELASRHPTREQERALYDLHCLEEATGQFLHQIGDRRDHRTIEREFEVLLGAFRTVQRSFYSLDPLYHVEEQFFDVDRLVGELKWRIEEHRRTASYSNRPYFYRGPHWYRVPERNTGDRDRIWLLPKDSRPNRDR